MTNWGIVGSGVVGLRLAQLLRQRGDDVTIYEAAPEIGGLASAWQIDDLTWDKFYHVFLLSDAHTLGLLEEIGLKDEIAWTTTRTGFHTDGKHYSLSSSLEFLKFPPLNLIDKFRLALTIMHSSRIASPGYLEEIPVETWLRKWSGSRTTEKIWIPLLKSKLGDDYRNCSASFLWATIQRMYAARRSGLKREMFGYVRGGYANVMAKWAAHLQSSGVAIRTGCAVSSIDKIGSQTQVIVDVHSHNHDRVVVTSAPGLAAKLLPGLNASERQRLDDVVYQGIVCPSVILNRPLRGFYVTNITDTGYPFTAVIEMSALVPPAELNGHHLAYLPKYVPAGDPLLTADDATIRESFVAGLLRMYPDLTPDNIVKVQIARAKVVFPLPVLHYSKGVPDFRTSLPGVYLVNSAQILNGTLNVNESLMLAGKALPALAAEGE